MGKKKVTFLQKITGRSPKVEILMNGKKAKEYHMKREESPHITLKTSHVEGKVQWFIGGTKAGEEEVNGVAALLQKPVTIRVRALSHPGVEAELKLYPYGEN